MSIFLIWIVNVGNIYTGTNRDRHQISIMHICHFRICIYVAPVHVQDWPSWVSMLDVTYVYAYAYVAYVCVCVCVSV